AVFEQKLRKTAFEGIYVAAGPRTLQDIQNLLTAHPHLTQAPVWATLSSPMLCMMKGLCARCVVPLGAEHSKSHVFACAHQEAFLHPLDPSLMAARVSLRNLSSAGRSFPP